jgi:hypothetical protein
MYWRYQQNTVLTDVLTDRATTDRLLPAFNSRIACRRRFSSRGTRLGRSNIDHPELLSPNRHSRLHMTTVKDGGFLLRTKAQITFHYLCNRQ